MLWFNELSLSCCYFCLTPWLLVQNCLILIDIIGYEKELQFKTNFLRLIGTHTGLFVILMFTLTMLINAIFDTFILGLPNILILAYIPFVIFIINKFMEEKT